MNGMNSPNMTPHREEISRVVQETLERLTPLLGVWKGRGRGDFPTIDTFDYRESLTIRRDGDAPFLTYEQSTELIDPESRSIRRSHWEAGLLRPLEDGGIEITCVQSDGRIEVLRGGEVASETLPGMLTLRFHSEHIANDERMRSSLREWSVTDTSLSYILKMATSMVEEPALHLHANLLKAGEVAG